MTPKEFENSHPRELLDILTLAVEMIGETYESETPEHWVYHLFVMIDRKGYCFANKETVARSMR